jgi:hypothetical protein
VRLDRVLAGVLCIAAGAATLVGAFSWLLLCEDGTFDRCQSGKPSLELVLQLVLASAGVASTVAALLLVRRGSRSSARALLAVAVLLLAAWALVLDAATHGWDDLRLLGLG